MITGSLIGNLPRSRAEFEAALLDLEVGFTGRSSDEGMQRDVLLSYLALMLGGIWFLVQFSGHYSMDLSERISRSDRILYSLGSSFFHSFLIWILSLTLLKRTFLRTPSIALLGVGSALAVYYVVDLSLEIALLTMRWDIIWANRVLTLLGARMTEAMTQDYLASQNWRLWPVIYLTWGLFGATYGVSKTKTKTFSMYFLIATLVVCAYALNPEYANYDVDATAMKLGYATAIGALAFALARIYSKRRDEYQVNRVKRLLLFLALFDFVLTIVIMDPPAIVQSLASYLEMVPVVGSLFSPLTEPGVPPSEWGGLFVNIIVASAGCVLGLGVGILLAFGRQSKLPILKWPSISIIEIVRSGPLICWLYFAMYLLPDVVDPLFTNPEDFDNIVRMMVIFSLFGGVYIAEVIRGGLQAVDSGQKEAAVALGLTPMQAKRLVELPNAIRTTLPTIVSQFIGLWKDTTLLFIINILDFFKIAKDMPNTDLSFLGYFLEPLYFSAVVFWVFAFYLSRVSIGVERGLGLIKDGGGEKA